MKRIAFCPSCGLELAHLSRFCPSCGARILKGEPPPFTPTSRTHPAHVTPLHSYHYHRHQSKSLKILVFIIITPGIIVGLLAVGFLVVLPMIGQSPYEYLGEKSELVIPFDNTTSTLRLELRNYDFGEISIITDPLMESLFQGIIQVYGREEYDIADANTFSYQTVGSKVTVEFTSDWPVDPNPFAYELVITTNQNVSIELDLEMHSGNMKVNLNEVKISDLDIKTITGNQNISLRQITRFSEYIPFLTSSSGRIDLLLTNINYTIPTTTWTITSSSGSISLTVKQLYGDMINSTNREFITNTPTGNIDVNGILSTDYGVRATAKAPSGSISWPTSKNEFQTANYGTAIWTYDFEMTTSTGRITFNYNNQL